MIPIFWNLFENFWTFSRTTEWLTDRDKARCTVPPKINHLCIERRVWGSYGARTSICICTVFRLHKHMLVHYNYLIHVFRCMNGLSWVGLSMQYSSWLFYALLQLTPFTCTIVVTRVIDNFYSHYFCMHYCRWNFFYELLQLTSIVYSIMMDLFCRHCYTSLSWAGPSSAKAEV